MKKLWKETMFSSTCTIGEGRSILKKDDFSYQNLLARNWQTGRNSSVWPIELKYLNQGVFLLGTLITSWYTGE